MHFTQVLRCVLAGLLWEGITIVQLVGCECQCVQRSWSLAFQLGFNVWACQRSYRCRGVNRLSRLKTLLLNQNYILFHFYSIVVYYFIREWQRLHRCVGAHGHGNDCIAVRVQRGLAWAHWWEKTALLVFFNNLFQNISFSNIFSKTVLFQPFVPKHFFFNHCFPKKF